MNLNRFFCFFPFLLFFSLFCQVTMAITPDMGRGGLNVPYTEHFELGQPFEFRINIRGGPTTPIFDWSICLGQDNGEGTCNINPDSCTDSLKNLTIDTDFPVGNNISVRVENRTAIITTNGAATLREGKFCFKLFANGNRNDYFEREYYIIVRKPFKLALVLDQSMSMECSPGYFPSTDTGNDPNDDRTIEDDDCIVALEEKLSRWDRLMDGVLSFSYKLAEDTLLTLPTDSMSIVFFSGDARLNDSLKLMRPIHQFLDTVSCNFFSQDTTMISCHMIELATGNPPLGRDGTSIGDGIEAALVESFGLAFNANQEPQPLDPAWKHAIFLVSDGYQNQNSRLRIDTLPVTPLREHRIIESRFDQDGNPLEELNLNHDNIENIEFFVVGIGTGPGYESLVARLASEEGFNRNLPAPETDTTAQPFFQEFVSNYIYNQFLEDFSPRNIHIEEKSLFINNSSTFNCQEGINKLRCDIYYSSPIGKRFRHRLLFNGEETEIFNRYLKTLEGNFFSTLSLDFGEIAGDSLFIEDSTAVVISKGEWTIVSEEISSLNLDTPVDSSAFPQDFDNPGNFPLPEKIKFVATADDQVTTFNTTLGKNVFRVGDNIDPEVEFLHRGIPIKGSEVFVTIQRPLLDLAEVLVNSDVNFDYDPLSESEGCELQKLNAIRSKQPEMSDSLRLTVTDTLQLENLGQGRFGGVSYTAIVSGVYVVTFYAQGGSGEIGIIQRVKEQTPVIQFSQLDNIVDSLVQVSTEGDITSLIFCPTFTTNEGKQKRVGLGYDYLVNVRGEDITLLGVSDLCDGCYEATIDNGGNPDPEVEICLSNDCVYGAIPIDPIRDTLFSPGFVGGLNIGYTVPAGDLADLQNGSFIVEGDIGYMILPSLGFTAVFGSYSFSSTDDVIDNFNVIGGTLFIRGVLDLGTNSTSALIGSLGGGWYSPRNDGGTLGWTIRAAGVREFGDNLFVNLQAGYMALNEPNVTFGILSGGIIFQF